MFKKKKRLLKASKEITTTKKRCKLSELHFLIDNQCFISRIVINSQVHSLTSVERGNINLKGNKTKERKSLIDIEGDSPATVVEPLKIHQQQSEN